MVVVVVVVIVVVVFGGAVVLDVGESREIGQLQVRGGQRGVWMINTVRVTVTVTVRSFVPFPGDDFGKTLFPLVERSSPHG